MILTTLEFTTDLRRGTQMEVLHNAFMVGDQEAHRFVVALVNPEGGGTVSLTGAGVQGFFVRRGEDSTVVINGESDGNKAIVTLPAACYAVPGRFSFIVRVSMGDTVHSVLWCDGVISRSRTDTLIDPGDVVPTLDELLGRISVLEAVTEAASDIVVRDEDAAGSATAAAKEAVAAAATATEASTQAQSAATTSQNAALEAMDADQSARAAANRAADSEEEAAVYAQRAEAAADRAESSGGGVTMAQGTEEVESKIPQITDNTQTYHLLDVGDIDATLAVEGKAADAKATGKAIAELTEEIEKIQESLGTAKMEWVDVGKVTTGAFLNGNQDSPFYAITQHANYAYAVAVVNHGRKYRVTCSSPTAPKFLVVFRDAEGVKIGEVPQPSMDEAVVYYENYEIEVPAEAYDMVISSFIGSSSSFVSCYPKIEEYREAHQEATLAEYEIEQLARRITQAEKANDFAWGTFDKAYFVFVHDDTNSFLSTAYNAFHAENTPMSAATVASMIASTYDGKTAKEWLDLIVADGGEVLMHYNADLLNDSEDDLWRTHVVDPKRVLESEGFEVRGLILANSSDVNSAKGEKFCRRYYDYADKVGTATRYNLGRKLMLDYSSLDAFKEHLDTCAQTPGLYAFGFHGLRTDEAWITESSLREIIQYINAKSNTEITTYGAVFDAIGTTVLEKRIAALESAN